MTGRPRRKIFCQSLTRRSKRPCQAKGYLCANGKYFCRFHGFNNIKGFNKPKYTDDTRIKQLQSLYQFRTKTREQVKEYYYGQVKPRITNNQKSRYFTKQSYRRKNPFGVHKRQDNQSLTDELDEILQYFKKKSRARDQSS